MSSQISNIGNPTMSPSSMLQLPPLSTSNTSSNSSSSSSIVSTIFSQSNLILIISIMILYAIIYSISRAFLGERLSIGYSGIFIDILAVIIVLYLMINFNTNYFTNSNDPIGSFFSWLRDYYDNISNVFLTILFVVFFYLFIYVLQVPMDPINRPYSLVIINGLLWAFLFVQLFNVLCMVIFGFSFADAILDPFIKGWYSLPGSKITPAPIKQTDSSGNSVMLIKDSSGNIQWINKDLAKLMGIKNNDYEDLTPLQHSPTTNPPTPTPLNISFPQNYYGCKAPTPYVSPDDGNEVFNIANNLYTYDDADAICQAFGSRLATYDEVEAAYNDGGEWCNYGWSADQMALFPTQKETWNRLQKTTTHKNDCGRPGVNGGYMDNPYLKFGVNCYGKKPDYQPKDLSGNTVQINTTAFNIGASDQARVDYWKKQIDQLSINSFNMNNWTEYSRTK